jgi:hypothetical protein
MDKIEVAKLLTRASAVDNRILSEATVEAWHELLWSVDYELAVLAVNEHFKTSTDYLLPVHIVQGVKVQRDRRDRQARVEAAKAIDMDAERLRRELEFVEPPKCEHGHNIARCLTCIRKMKEEN